MIARLAAAADFLAGRTGLLERRFSAERLIAMARRRAGLAEFGGDPLAEPLQRLLDACLAEAALSLVGRIALSWDALRLLTNRLRLHALEVREPAIQEESIEAPIFITGLPRSGTSFLHEMMLCDADNRAPLVFETIDPCPRVPDRRAERVARQLRMFGRLAPEFPTLHRLSARSPQECTEILALSFRSLRFDTTYRIPSYRRWLEADIARHLSAYRLHRRYLQHLQHQGRSGGAGPKRWVLKCPDHLFALPALGSVYPDARLVFVHRDPLKVLLSVTKLTEVLRRPFSRRVDPIALGEEESARWLEGAERMIGESSESRFAQPICHIHYLDLVRDPVATIEGLYRHFGLALPERAAAAIRRADQAAPNGGYGPRTYRFAEHGLDAAREREKFAGYVAHFGVMPEAVGAAAAAGGEASFRPESAAAGAYPG